MAIAGVNQSLINKMSSSFATSSKYNEAMNLTKNLLDKVSSNKTSYSGQLQGLLNQYNTKQKFSYDINKDALFQNSLSSAMNQGKNAMQDTIGQAAALTGGYANSFATSAGNQAYNQFVKGAYDNLPAYYQMALDAYNQEDQRLVNKINITQTADQTEYSRNMDAYAVNKDMADTMYNQELSKWQSEVSNATNSANLQNTDHWNNANYKEQIRQYNTNYDFQKAQADQQQKNWENDHKLSVQQLELYKKQAQNQSRGNTGEGTSNQNSSSSGNSDVSKLLAVSTNKNVINFMKGLYTNAQFCESRGKSGKSTTGDVYKHYIMTRIEKCQSVGALTDDEVRFIEYQNGISDSDYRTGEYISFRNDSSNQY